MINRTSRLTVLHLRYHRLWELARRVFASALVTVTLPSTALAYSVALRLESRTAMPRFSIGGHLFVADSTTNRVLAFRLANGLASTQPDFVIEDVPGPTFIGFDDQQELFVACAGERSIRVYDSVGGKWALSRTLLPGPQFTAGAIALDASGYLYVTVGQYQNVIAVYAPGSYGDANPVNQIQADHGVLSMTTDSAGALFVSEDYPDIFVYSSPRVEQNYDSEIFPTRFEGRLEGAASFDQIGDYWARYIGGNGYNLWQAADFVQRDLKRSRGFRHFETRDCWIPGDFLRDSYSHWDDAPIYTSAVASGYLYYSCLEGAYSWQYAVFAYDVKSGEGHRTAIESIGPPIVQAPFGLAVGP